MHHFKVMYERDKFFIKYFTSHQFKTLFMHLYTSKYKHNIIFSAQKAYQTPTCNCCSSSFLHHLWDLLFHCQLIPQYTYLSIPLIHHTSIPWLPHLSIYIYIHFIIKTSSYPYIHCLSLSIYPIISKLYHYQFPFFPPFIYYPYLSSFLHFTTLSSTLVIQFYIHTYPHIYLFIR